MKILFIVPSMALGGGVPAVAHFLRGVAIESGFEVKVISLNMSKLDPVNVSIKRPLTWFSGVTSKIIHSYDVSFIEIGSYLSEFEFQRYQRRKILSKLVQSSDLVQVVAGSPAIANAVVGLGKPVALQVATLAKVERRSGNEKSSDMLGYWRKLMTEITDFLDRRALKLVDAIQVENSWMLEYALRLNKGRHIPIEFAPPGVDLDFFTPLQDRSPLENSYILCVGRFSDHRKNLVLLLSAYAKLPPKLIQNVRLVLAGSSPPTQEFWALAKSMGLIDNILFVNNPTNLELVEIMRNASVFALPSDEEGLGIVVLEAMACGIPVVSTLCGGPEGIIDNGLNGFLTPLNDSGAMASQLEYLLKHELVNLEMGILARQKVEKYFNKDLVGKKFIRIWNELLD